MKFEFVCSSSSSPGQGSVGGIFVSNHTRRNAIQQTVLSRLLNWNRMAAAFSNLVQIPSFTTRPCFLTAPTNVNHGHLPKYYGCRLRLSPSAITCSSSSHSNTLVAHQSSEIVQDKSVSVILLAGGKGKRMGASMPKQYLPLLGQPIALYSFLTFSDMDQVKEIIVVCDPSYNDIFEETAQKVRVNLKFTIPGKERQDSVYSGLQAIDPHSQLVCIHDSARPLVTSKDIDQVLRDGWVNGAAVLGVPVKATIKEANGSSFVVKTLDRRTLWEMQTPQVIKPELLQKGFELVNREHLEVTDDVSIVEHLRHPVYITEGSYTNIKVTTPDDLLLAERILSTHH